MSSRKTTILYWVFTGIFAAFMLLMSYTEFRYDATSVAAMRSLGYPEHILPVLGLSKLIGAIVLLVPGMRTLKEWAYAGFTFDFIGAAIAIIVSGFAVGAILPLAFLVVLLLPSYIFWKKKTGQPITL